MSIYCKQCNVNNNSVQIPFTPSESKALQVVLQRLNDEITWQINESIASHDKEVQRSRQAGMTAKITQANSLEQDVTNAMQNMKVSHVAYPILYSL